MPFRLCLAALLALILAAPLPALAQDCTLDGVALAAGQEAAFYSARSVSRGQSCAALAGPRRCEGGSLAGRAEFRHARCTELEGFLGVNTNRRAGQLEPELLARTGTEWIRTNVEILEYKEQEDTGKKDPDWDFSDWQTYIAAAEGSQRKAILNLMWDFEAHDRRPPLPGSADEADLFGFLDRVILATLADHVEIIVTGNEPFVNTAPRDLEPDAAYGGIPLVVFYQRATQHVHDYLVARGLRGRVDVYVGAFTRLQNRKMQRQPAVEQMLAFADSAFFVDGVDVHTHVSDMAEMEEALQFLRGATDKPIIVTEFSYIWRMQEALKGGDRLGAAFAGRWGYDPGMASTDYLACEVFGAAKGCRRNGPVSKAEWDDFLASRPWAIDHFILKADAVFRQYGVRGATFGLVQDEPRRRRLQAGKLPWYLGFLFAGASVEPGPDGAPQPNYQYLDDFRSLQRR